MTRPRLGSPAGIRSGLLPRAPRFAAGRALDARALYLMPEDSLHVSSTGEALVVTRPDGEVYRLPATRLMRVVCNERVHWSGAALALCQARGITVTWLAASGRALGHLWPASAPRGTLAEALDVLAGMRGDWSQRYDNWRRRQRLIVLQRWQAERSQSGQPVPADEWQRAKQAWVYRGEVGEHLPAVLQGLVASLVVARLAEEGVALRHWCPDGECIDIAADLGRLVWAELNLCGGAIAEALHGTRDAAAVFEQWSTRCADLLYVHLARLKATAQRELHG